MIITNLTHGSADILSLRAYGRYSTVIIVWNNGNPDSYDWRTRKWLQQEFLAETNGDLSFWVPKTLRMTRIEADAVQQSLIVDSVFSDVVIHPFGGSSLITRSVTTRFITCTPSIFQISFIDGYRSRMAARLLPSVCACRTMSTTNCVR